jgi:ABC-type cobalamin/Fe3+-siderophores transport system ATPase subunit
MRKLTIKKVGPITNTAEIEFNRFCILIGPQSNGKSTIAKVMSTCMWIEKEACTSLSTDIIDSGASFRKLIEDFHRIHGYIHPENSYISYQSDYVSIIYDKDDFFLSFKDIKAYHRLKISYMPSDRNVVTMKDLEKREMESTNFRSFLFDWLDANKRFGKEKKVSILNLDIKYYFDDSSKTSRDRVVHENGVSYDISLNDSSSGMQSVVPLTVLMRYLLTDYFENYDKEISFEQREKNIELSWKIVKDILLRYYPGAVTEENYRTYFNENVKKKYDQEDVEAKKIMDEMRSFYKQLTKPNSISFILEEPEQNLYPSTQVELLKEIVKACNGVHPSTALITTHSPYILTIINNLIYASKVGKVNPETVSSIIPRDMWMSPEEVSAYYVANGTVTCIIDEDIQEIKAELIDEVSQSINEQYELLSNIEYAGNHENSN